MPVIDRVLALVLQHEENSLLTNNLADIQMKKSFGWVDLCALFVGCRGTQLTNAISNVGIHLDINLKTSRSTPLNQKLILF